MNENELIAKVRELIVDTEKTVFSDDEILSHIEDALIDYGDKTKMFKGVFNISKSAREEHFKSEPYYGISRNMAYNDIGLDALPPQPSVRPLKGGYPEPLVTPVENIEVDIVEGITTRYVYPAGRLQTMFGVSLDGDTISAKSLRRIEKGSDLGFPRYIYDDGVTPPQYELYPKQDGQDIVLNVYTDGTFYGKIHMGFSIVDGVMSEYVVYGLGTQHDGLGIGDVFFASNVFGKVHYVRTPLLDEVKDYMAIVYYVAKELYLSRSELKDSDRMVFFDSMYKMRVARTNRTNIQHSPIMKRSKFY